MKIRTKILTAFFVVFASMGGACVLALHGFGQIRQDAKVALDADDLVLATVQVQQFLTDVSATHQTDGFNDARHWADEFARTCQDLQTLLPGDPILATLQPTFDPFYGLGKKMAEAYLTEGVAAGNVLMKGSPQQPGFDGLSEQISAKVDQLRNAAVKRLRGQQASETDLVLVVALLAALFSAGIAFWFAGTIVRPLRSLKEAAEGLASGDLGQVVTVHTRDELGEMADSFRRMVENLKEIVGRVRNASGSVAAGSDEIGSAAEQLASAARSQAETVEATAGSTAQMAASVNQVAGNANQLEAHVEETSSAIAELAASINQVAGGARSLAEAVDQTSSSIEEMAGSIRQVASNVDEATGAAHQAAAAARGGNQAVGQTVDGMAQINQVMSQVVGIMGSLGQSSNEIGSIIEVISDIAEQTNLLALNAAIEAARAGEHGRGFAVVADEVRKLAERSAGATKEIAALILGIQREAKQAIDSTRHGEQAIQSGVTLARTAGEALGEIVASIEAASEMMTHISSATKEQSLAAETITRAVGQMSALTQQVSLATREQAKGSEQIIKSVEAMNRMTREVASAADEQRKGGEHIAESVEGINRSAREAAASVAQISRATGGLQLQARQLVEAVSLFKVAESGPRHDRARSQSQD